jgi:hypothetical protein
MINSNQELLDATFQAYVVEKEPFGYDEKLESCVYRSHNGKACAIGRHLEDSAVTRSIPLNFRVVDLKGEYPELWFKSFSKDVSLKFAQEIQTAHDASYRISARESRENLATKLVIIAVIYNLKTPQF